MPLYAYNLTTSTIQLPGVSSVKLPASPQTNQRGPAFNITSNLRPISPDHPTGLTRATYTGLQVLVVRGLVVFAWSLKPEYETPGLSTESPDVKEDPSIAQSAPIEYPVIVRVIKLDEPTDGEQGLERSVEIFPPLEFPLRILLVTGAISRGAPGAQVYLCCHPAGGHEPHTDRFDASQPGMLYETSHVDDRVIEEGEELYLYCSSDYVQGYLTVMFQRVAS